MKKQFALTVISVLWFFMTVSSQNWNWTQVLSLNLPSNNRIVGMASNGHDVSFVDSTQYLYVSTNSGFTWFTFPLLSNSVASCITMYGNKVFYGTTGVGRNDVYYSYINNLSLWDSLPRGYPAGQRFTYVTCMGVIGSDVFTGNGIGLWRNDTLIAYGNHYNMESILVDSTDLYAASGVLLPGYAIYHCDTALAGWTISLALDTSYGNEKLAISNGFLYRTNSGTYLHRMWKCSVIHPISCLDLPCWQQVSTPHNFRRIVAIADTLLAVATDAVHPIQTMSDTLFASTDGGVTWNKVVNGLPSKYMVNALVATKNDMYIGIYCYSYARSFVYRNRPLLTTSISANSYNHSEEDMVYPNPATEKVFVECNDCSVKIYDLAGGLILSAKNTGAIDLSGVKPGVYLLRIEDKDRSSFRKIVVIR